MLLLSTSQTKLHFHPIPERRKRSQKKTYKTTTTRTQISATKTRIPNQTVKISTFQSSLQNPAANLPDSAPFQSLDPNALAFHLKSCSTLKEVKCVHAISLRSLQTSIAFVGNILISGYLQFSSLVDAKKLFDLLPERNIVTWTAILNGYQKFGLDDEVLELFEELIESGIQANSLTFVCLLKCCGNLADFGPGRQIHACVVKGNWSNLIVESAIIYFYAQCGKLPDASRVFDRMPVRDVVTWTTMISAYAREGRGNEALVTFSRMQHCGFRPNEFTLCSVLKACGEEKALRFGRQLHSTVVKGMFLEDVYIGSAFVAMYVKCGEVSDARLVFNLMPKRNTVTWTSMISGYARNGLGEEAIALFHKMKRRCVFANNLTIVSIISACGSIGSLILGKELHGQILKKLLQSNSYIDSTFIWFYCKCGEYSYAARVFEAMPERDVISWTAMISGHNSLERGSEALKFLNEMLLEGVEPTAFTYSSALKACAKAEEVGHGKWIHGSANKTSALSSVYVGSALIDMYMKCECVKDAYRVFETMPERNLVSWKSMIIGYAKNGHCREAMKLMYQMQAEGFSADDYVVSTVLSSCGGDVQWEVEHSSDSCSVTS